MRQPDFLKLWTGQTISEFGSQVSLLAIPFVAIKVLHASAFSVAALGMVEQLPFLLLALPAGVWIDRLARRPILIAGDAGRAVALLSIPVAKALGVLTLGQLFAVGFVTGVLTVFFDVAYQSYLPSLVPREQLVEGNSKLQVSASGAQLAGPSLAGALIGFVSAPFAILADAASFVVSSGFVLGIRRREELPARRPGEPTTGMRHELFEGLRHVLHSPYLRPIAATTAASNFAGSIGWSILLVYLVRKLGLSAQAIGLVLSLANVGVLAGALAAKRISQRLGIGRTIVLSAALFGPSMVMIPLAPRSFPIPLLVTGLALLGLTGVVYNITQVSLRQAITPERLQGRMNSVMRFIVWGVLPLGALLGGTLASTIGLRPTLWASGACSLVSWLPVYFSRLRTLERVPEEEPISATQAAASGGVAGGLVAGVDSQGVVAGTGPASTDA